MEYALWFMDEVKAVLTFILFAFSCSELCRRHRNRFVSVSLFKFLFKLLCLRHITSVRNHSKPFKSFATTCDQTSSGMILYKDDGRIPKACPLKPNLNVWVLLSIRFTRQRTELGFIVNLFTC